MDILDSTITGHLCPGIHPTGGPCLEPIRVGQTHCEICGTTFLWSDNPEAARRKLKLTPSDDLGKRLLQYASQGAHIRIYHFSKPEDKRRWDHIIGIVPEHQIRSEVNRCAQKAKGYGLVKYTLNALDKLIRDGRVEEAPVVDPAVEYVP